MFNSLAGRLTAWYVFVAIGIAVLLSGVVAFVGLEFYANSINEQIVPAATQVPDIESRIRAERVPLPVMLGDLRRRIESLSRPGLSIWVRLPGPPHRLRRGPGGPPPFGRAGPPFSQNAFDRANGPGSRDEAASRFQRYRIGFAASQLIGIRPVRITLADGFGEVGIGADPARVQELVAFAIAVIVGMGLLGGIFAWGTGRYITSEALRPLVDVTAALQRFAGRDFTAQSIDVERNGEFRELALAYNAAAAQVQQAFEERALAEEYMRQFVADAGHELRTPLTIVLGYIDLLKRRAPDDERSRRIFETIAIEGSRMRILIDNLVLLTKLESDDMRPAEPFDLSTLLEHDVVETRRGIAPLVRFDLDIDVDATIIGDRAEIYEAIANVVDNAIKYGASSPIGIHVSADGATVTIAISDRGPGIAEADQASIFDRFYRGSLRGQIEGSGLGLAIAKRAIERAGGTLSLTQSSPAGTTFTLCLRADRVKPRGEIAQV